MTEWIQRAGEFIVASGLITQPASRVIAISHTAAFEAANAITRRYPATGRLKLDAPAGALAEAAIAAAHRGVLAPLLPAQQGAIDAAYQKARCNALSASNLPRLP